MAHQQRLAHKFQIAVEDGDMQRSRFAAAVPRGGGPFARQAEDIDLSRRWP